MIGAKREKMGAKGFKNVFSVRAGKLTPGSPKIENRAVYGGLKAEISESLTA